jgi:hypothetical protein
MPLLRLLLLSLFVQNRLQNIQASVHQESGVCPPLFVLVREYWPPLISICLHLCGSRRRDTARPLLPTASHLRCAPNSHDNASHVVLTMQGPNSRSDSSIPATSSSRTCPTSHESAVIDKCSTALRPLLLQFTLTMSSSLPLSKR